MADGTPAPVEGAPAAAPKKKKSLLPIIIAAAVVVVGAAGAGVYFAVSGGDEEDETAQAEDSHGDKKDKKDKKGKKEAAKAPAVYVKLEPPFVVNFEAKGMMRFLQVSIEVMTRDPKTAEDIKAQDPMIRNDLLMLLSNQSFETITTREGKDQLRKQSLEVVAKIIEQEGGDPKKVEQLYFTSFVMQ